MRQAHFEVVNLVEVELRQELAAAKRELEVKRQKTIECEATIAKLEREEKEWKAKYLELASKLSSQPSEPQPMGTESSCTTPTAAITPLAAVPATSELLHEPQVTSSRLPFANEPALTPLPPRSPMTPTTSCGKVVPCLSGVKGR